MAFGMAEGKNQSKHPKSDGCICLFDFLLLALLFVLLNMRSHRSSSFPKKSILILHDLDFMSIKF